LPQLAYLSFHYREFRPQPRAADPYLLPIEHPVAVDYADGVLDREQVRVSGTRLRAKLAVVEAQIGELGQVDVVAPLVLAGDMDVMRAVWDGYPVTTRRLVIAKVMQVVVLRGRRGRPPVGVGFDPASVRVTWLSGSG
ncbi:MAG TPA: hypothetical protein VNV66_14375, partial [Pilimelia sp.]|nr:hypothetical protein [Pilimelia sp.]